MMNNGNGMDPQDQRNFLIAMALMIAFVFLYQTVVVGPENARRKAATEAAKANAPVTQSVDAPISTAPLVVESVEDALNTSDRLIFDADRVDGSIRLQGAVLDDLNLKSHYKTVAKKEELRLLRPENSKNGYTVSWSWLEQGKVLVGEKDMWTTSDTLLKTGNAAVLNLTKDGLQIERTIDIDENYMFSYTDRITNTSGADRVLRPYGQVKRFGQWKDFLEATDPGSSKKMGLAHQGLLGAFDKELTWRNYTNLAKGKGLKKSEDGRRSAQEGGWVGLTDMYWMAALIPEQQGGFTATVRDVNPTDTTRERLDILMSAAPVTVGAGKTVTVTNRIFAGAKEYDVVREYEQAGIPRFDDSIDWGSILRSITKPLFSLLNWLNAKIGSFGLAILALVVLVKIPLIPLYNASYKSMAKMKKLTEPMKEIQERFKADPQRRQQEIMKLYKREKANPLAGCIPILFTIPVFFALYKVLYVTLEMRHTSFMFLNDLSAPDPTAIGNLFGLIPWMSGPDIAAIPILGFVIGIGILPIMYGVTMAGIQALSPPPADPTQRTIMMALPFVFMFIFGGFASGLVLYWVWSNILSLIQQYYIMRRNGVETELDKLVKRLLGRAPKEAE